MFIEDTADSVIAIAEDRQLANEILHRLHAGGFSDAESFRHGGDDGIAGTGGIRIKVPVQSRSERSCAISLVRDIGGDVEGMGPESTRPSLAMTIRALPFGEG
jgi:hypothetical protein